MTKKIYIPNLKTSDSELRALRFLSNEVRESILPVFELTRSRITKKHPDGSASRRAEQLMEIYGGSPFILDLTTETDLTNSEMESFFEQEKGYARWRSFLESSFDSKIIPCLQYDEGGSEAEFKRQAEYLAQRFGKVALRTSVSDLEASQLYVWALEAIGQKNITVIGSIYFMEQNAEEVYFDRCSRFISTVIGNRPPEQIALPGSSFPKSVGNGDYGEDDGGEFSSSEFSLYQRIKKNFPNAPLVYSDYASVHPIRYPTRGGSWVPRIDVFSNNHFAFSRFREADGGYVEAARNIMKDYETALPDCWGADQIKQAATGSLPGRSPSFWISVRINMWINQRVDLLSGF
jgi:hypothetical protein